MPSKIQIEKHERLMIYKAGKKLFELSGGKKGREGGRERGTRGKGMMVSRIKGLVFLGLVIIVF